MELSKAEKKVVKRAIKCISFKQSGFYPRFSCTALYQNRLNTLSAAGAEHLAQVYAKFFNFPDHGASVFEDVSVGAERQLARQLALETFLQLAGSEHDPRVKSKAKKKVRG